MKQIITIEGKPVIDIYEFSDGSYWYITEKLFTMDHMIQGKFYKNDQILFGFVSLVDSPECADWGFISETELKLLYPRVWKVPRINWSVCPMVAVESIRKPRKMQDAEGTESPRSALCFKSTERGYR